MTVGPVRALRLPVAWRCAPREASRLSLDAPPRCFESASKTDVCSRAPAAKTPSLETARRAPWRNPPAFCFEILLELGVAASFAEDAGPPRGHPASNGSVLDATSPASGRQAVAPALSRRAEERGSFFGCFTLRPPTPLTPPPRLKRGTRERSRLPSLISLPRAARQCRPPSRDRGAFHRGSPQRAPSRAPAWSSAPAGRRARLLHVFIDVRKPRLDRSSRRFRVRFLAACASTTSADRCFNEHCLGPLEHPGPVGRDGRRFDRSLPLDRWRPPRVRRVRGRGSPSLDAPSRDCSRERLCPNPDRLGHLVSRASPVTLPGVDAGDERGRQRGAR